MAERIVCPNCGHETSAHRGTCKRCGTPLRSTSTSGSSEQVVAASAPSTMPAVVRSSGPMMPIQQVPLASIEDVKLEDLSQSRIQDLLHGAEPFDGVLNSQTNPITLDGANPPYQIIEGRHRVYLARQKGYMYVPARNLGTYKPASLTIASALPIERRKEILEKEISKYVQQGWRVNSRTDTTAQLVRDQQASCLVALILAIFFIVPAILYLMLFKGTQSMYLEVDEQGNIKATGR